MDCLDFLKNDAEIAAPRLLGCYLERTIDNQKLIAKIVEVEAYDQTDTASHSYLGQTPRNDVMFGDYGHLYVYFTYGMHYCCNVVCGFPGKGAAVLIRALEPIKGEAAMKINRKYKSGITNGPAKLCQALNIDKSYNGHDLTQSPIRLIVQPAIDAKQIIQTTRIGIRRATDTPWRFLIKDNPCVSQPPAMIG